jgi:NCS1 family nucleobase:cation symporter-1
MSTSTAANFAADTRLANADLLPVDERHRTWSLWNMAALWVGMAITIPTYTLASSLVARGWTWQAAVGSVVLGNLIVLIPIALISHAGTRYGIPFPVLARASFGVFGANVPALLRAVVACGWFGIQTWIGGSAIFKLLEVMWPGIATLPAILPGWMGLGTGEFLCFMFFWALNLWIALRGMESIKFLETYGSPFLLAVGVALFAWAWIRSGGLGPMLVNPPPSATGETHAGVTAVFGAGLTSAVAFWGTMALSIPDFSRYAKSQRDQIVGQALGLPATMALFSFIGAAVTSATVVIFGTRIADPIELMSQIGGPITVIIAMFGLAVATLTTNIAANVVAPANGFSNVAPTKISFKTGVLITAVIGILMMPWRLYSDAAAYIFTWLIGYGALLGPVAGILITDYFLLRRHRLDVEGLYRRDGVYAYQNGVNWVAMVALVLGIAPNLPGFLGAIGVVEVSALAQGVYEWAWFVGFAIAALIYVIGMQIVGAVPSPSPAAARVSGVTADD